MDNSYIIKRLLKCKDKYWKVLDWEMLQEYLWIKERDYLREKKILFKLPNVNVYCIIHPNDINKSEDLIILMNKFHILKYYSIKYNSIFSPNTYISIIENSEWTIKFKLLSIDELKSDKKVRIWQIKIEIENSWKIYKQLFKNGYTETYLFWNVWFKGIPKSLYYLFWKNINIWLTSFQKSFLEANKKLLDKRIKLNNIDIEEFDEKLFEESQFKYLKSFKEKIEIFKQQLTSLKFDYKGFDSEKEYFEYINQQKVNDIYNTTTIEWEEIYYEELVLFLKWKKEIFEKEPKKLQIIWYEKAFQNVLSWKITIDEPWIKKIHFDIFYPIYEQGFANEPTWWIYSISNRFIDYKTPYMTAKNIWTTILPSSDKIPYLMNELDIFLKEEQNIWIFEKAIIFHILFIYIHPFWDWNWRTARLFFNNMLLKDRIWWIVIPWEERDTYFDNIYIAINENNITYFAKYYYEKLINWNKNIRLYK